MTVKSDLCDSWFPYQHVFTCFPYIKIPKASSVRLFQSIYRGRGKAEGFLPSCFSFFLSFMAPRQAQATHIILFETTKTKSKTLFPSTFCPTYINFNHTSQTSNNRYQVQEHMKFAGRKVIFLTIYFFFFFFEPPPYS